MRMQLIKIQLYFTAKWKYWQSLWEISEVGPIIRRYFTMNFFDGVLTALGIVLGLFFGFLRNHPVGREILIIQAVTTAIAIGISGLIGSHLAESAERRLNILEVKRVLGLLDQNGKEIEDENQLKPKWSERDLRLALGKFDSPKHSILSKSIPISINFGLTSDQRAKLNQYQIISDEKSIKSNSSDSIQESTPISTPIVSPTQGETVAGEKQPSEDEEEIITIHEKAQHFASRIAAIVDGVSPFLGVNVVIIPFLIPTDHYAQLWQFIASFVLTIVTLFLLGSYLAKLSKDSIFKYGIQMVLAALIATAVSFGFQRLIPNT